MTIIQQLLTGKDGETNDLGRWSWVICMGAVLLHDAFQLYRNIPVDVRDLAIALSAVAAAHGIAIGAKSHTEPQ